MIKALICFSALLILAGCAKESSSSTIYGNDLSGTYQLKGIVCVDAAGAGSTATGQLTAGSSSESFTIVGNNITTLTNSPSGCRTKTSRSFLANLTDGDMNGGQGTGSLGATKKEIENGAASCTHAISFNMTQGSLTPSSVSVTDNQGEESAAKEFDFIISDTFVAFGAPFQVTGRPTDICVLIYQKL